jgi:hypothetical protein
MKFFEWISKLWSKILNGEQLFGAGTPILSEDNSRFPMAPSAFDGEIIDTDLVVTEQESVEIRQRNLFRNILIEEASASLKKERDMLAKINFDQAIAKAIRYAIDYKTTYDFVLISPRNIGIDDCMLPHFLKVFQVMCKPYNIKVKLNDGGHYIYLDKPSFTKALSSLIANGREEMLDDAMKNLLYLGPHN